MTLQDFIDQKKHPLKSIDSSHVLPEFIMIITSQNKYLSPVMTVRHIVDKKN